MKFILILKQYILIIYLYLCGCKHYLLDRDEYSFIKKKKYAFIFFAANYNNLGDIAITVAQEKFLTKQLDGRYMIVKVPVEQTYSVVKKIKKLDKKDILITMVGGGNNGSLYEFIEAPRRFVLWKLKNYKIISFPQTVVFENKLKLNPYRRSFQICCNRCKSLWIFAREKQSFNRYRKLLCGKVFMTPDIVFSLKIHEIIKLDCRKKDTVACIFRDDKEKLLSQETQDHLVYSLQGEYDLKFWDTCDVIYKKNESVQLVEDYLQRLGNVQFAITDRLHGMILCYISQTPCIVIDNNNGKIKSTYETWMQEQNFIKIYNPKDGISTFKQLVMTLTNLKKVDFTDLSGKFEPLINSLKED